MNLNKSLYCQINFTDNHYYHTIMPLHQNQVPLGEVGEKKAGNEEMQKWLLALIPL